MDKAVLDLRDEFVPGRAAATPPEQPLEMREQDLARWDAGAALPLGKIDMPVIVARVFVFALAIALTGLGTWEIVEVVAVAGVTWLQVVFAALFAVTFAWIAFACAGALVGFWYLLWERGHPHAPLEADELGRTALAMPVYNEDPRRVFGALDMMARELIAVGVNRQFDIFVLSDTRHPELAEAEVAAFEAMRARLEPAIHVFYRRRKDNAGRKAGNIAEFVRRWGGRYDHMIVLDADSYMTAGAMVSLAQRMAADPRAGIIQTLPVLANRNTLFARMQQFATRVYGPVIATGLAVWHGRDGNYWGHNAIIRTRAFAECAGLPVLPGRKPFGGHIMSHDFVEAALLRRGGWAVYMAPEVEGSYEECPPSLIDLAVRDRRWAQGNLQHMQIIGAKGLHWVSRLHFLNGIMSYLASPLWFLMLASGLVLSAQAKYIRPEYFPEGFSLFPKWPVFDPERALQLFGFTMAVLLLPKLLGVVAAAMDRRLRRGCGGILGLTASMLVETVLSALLSPIMMLIQSRVVLDALLGRDSGWDAQNRDDGSIPIAVIGRRHWSHVVVGLLAGAAAFSISREVFLWFTPILLGLVLAMAVSWATGLKSLGLAFRSARLFLIPEEQDAIERMRLAPPLRPVAASNDN